jgi:hypothetical protein
VEKNDETAHTLLFPVFIFIVSKGATIFNSWRRTGPIHICDLFPRCVPLLKLEHDDIRLAVWRTQASVAQSAVRSDDGCSAGIVPILLGREERTVIGIDSKPKSIAEANARPDEEPSFVQERIEFVGGDVLAYNGLKGKQFDTVIMSELLEQRLQY